MRTDSKWCCDTTTPESLHTKDESKRGSAFAFIFGVNWLWRCGVTASFGVVSHKMKCNEMTSFMEFIYSVTLEGCKSATDLWDVSWWQVLWHWRCLTHQVLTLGSPKPRIMQMLPPLQVWYQQLMNDRWLTLNSSWSQQPSWIFLFFYNKEILVMPIYS